MFVLFMQCKLYMKICPISEFSERFEISNQGVATIPCGNQDTIYIPGSNLLHSTMIKKFSSLVYH